MLKTGLLIVIVLLQSLFIITIIFFFSFFIFHFVQMLIELCHCVIIWKEKVQSTKILFFHPKCEMILVHYKDVHLLNIAIAIFDIFLLPSYRYCPFNFSIAKIIPLNLFDSYFISRLLFCTAPCTVITLQLPQQQYLSHFLTLRSCPYFSLSPLRVRTMDK